jgi:hypothetical protein
LTYRHNCANLKLPLINITGKKISQRRKIMPQKIKEVDVFKAMRNFCIKAKKERFLEIKSWISEYMKTGDLKLKRKIDLTIKKYAKEDAERKKRIEIIAKRRQILFKLKNTKSLKKQQELRKQFRLCC